MALKKFLVIGTIRIAGRSKISGDIRVHDSSFERVVYSTGAEEAKEMVCDSVMARRTKSKVFDLVDAEFVGVEVFEKVDV